MYVVVFEVVCFMPSDIYVFHVSAQTCRSSIASSEGLEIRYPCRIWWRVRLPINETTVAKPVEFSMTPEENRVVEIRYRRLVKAPTGVRKLSELR